MSKRDLALLEAELGYEFKDGELLKKALTHRSFHFENKDKSPGHFERLEFLGDAVLDLILSESLMSAFPDVDEGTLSKWRASLVNESTLCNLAREMELGHYLFLGRSESANREQSQDRPRMLASALEAVIAAVYQDGGLEAAREFIARRFEKLVSQLDPEVEFATDYKTRLQEWAQKTHKALPEYQMVGSDGPEHAKTFIYEVSVMKEVMGRGEGASRKMAEQEAARMALENLGDKK
ncbi:MAG: ribonuclease III [Bdellovibrionales bacterium]